MKKSKLVNGESLDAVVIGSGLSGLLASAFLLRQGRSVVLLEKLAQWGGRLSPEQREGFQLGCGFQFANPELVKSVADRLGLEIPTLRLENVTPLQHSTRGWVPVEKEEIPAWEAYLAQANRELPEKGYAALTAKLFAYCEANPQFRFYPLAPLTGLEISQGKLGKISVGPDVDVSAKDIFWTADFKTLLETLKGDSVPEAGPERVSWLRRFSKSIAQPAVVLEFAHKQKLSDFTENLLLGFSAGDKEEKRYLVGAFLGNRDPSVCPEGKNLSSWILPLTEAEWGDNHETMKKIRAARRLLEKAFESFESSLLFDRVLVLENSLSPLGKKKGEWKPLAQGVSLLSDWASPYGASPDGTLTLLLERFEA